MRKFLSVVVICTLLFAGLVALPRRAGSVFTPEASAQVPTPTPSIPPLPGDSSPSPSPKPSNDDGDGDGKDGDGKNGDGGSKDGGSKDGGGGSKDGSGGKNGGGGKKKKSGDRKGLPGGNLFVGDYHPSGGSYNTDKLMLAATRLRALGLSNAEVIKEAYAPFIIAGDAAWSDTWGAPRYGPGPIVRTHEGQDVFCHFGDPILAPESGTVSYSNGGLGGITARVHTSSSSYWYLTHLSALNNEVYPGGSAVRPGDVIGFCGNSGNAATTPPHVHFGWYVNGKAKDPLNSLVRWLRQAEARVTSTITKKQNKRVAQIDRLTTARFFGDWAGPDLSELYVSGESLWASGSSPATGAFGLAEAALQAALADGGTSVMIPNRELAADADDSVQGSAISRYLRPQTSADAGDGASD